MAKKKHEMVIRAEAFEQTRKHFIDKEYELGKVDCIRLARFHALKMGHKPPKIPRYSTPLQAKRVLTKMGHDSVDDLLASMFPKIPLAMARIGDMVTGEGSEGLDATFIYTGRKLMGFHEEAPGLVLIVPELIKSAFRV